jgi:[protein-PII] uridylyltransferase
MDAMFDTELFNAAEFDSRLAKHRPHLELFRHTLSSAQEELKARWLAGRTATELVPLRARLIDKILVRAWRLFFPADEDIALVAVGGYGRGELHPYSDVDLMLLVRSDATQFRQPIEAFLTFLWDIGLETGHSVRTVDECVREAEQDISVATNLQEARLLLGPEDLYLEQQTRCGPNSIWPSRKFFTAKWDEQRRRHAKFNDTAYNLEPNFKEGPGGLRDIQMLGWIAKRHYGVRDLKELIAHGFLTEAEYKTLFEGQALLWQIRFGIHLYTGRREDRLLFDHQRRLAQQFGYRDNPKHRGVEQFMMQYYRTVMELNRLNEMLLQLFQEEILYTDEPGEPFEINNRFQSRKGFLEAKNEQVFEKTPFALLEAFVLMAQNPNLKGVRANTIRMLRDHRHLIDDKFRNDLACRSLFMELLRHGTGVTHELRRMNRYGILAAYLPVFGNIVGQMQHDLFHVYTVDEHTLFVIRNIRRFSVEEHQDEFPFCSNLIKSIPKQELLVIGGLFHDIAKGRGGDHSTLGAKDAFEFCKHHGLSDYDGRLVAWLVQNHLIMSTTAQKKDTSDPDVVHEFAKVVGDYRHLDYLYLLTVADIRATSPSLWNSWKDALLKHLYIETRKALRRGLDNPIIRSENIAQTKLDALTQLKEHGVTQAQAESVWSSLGDEYFLRCTPKEIAWHTEAILAQPDNRTPLILIDEKSPRGGTEIVVYTADNLNLFARLTHVLDQLQLNVVEARIITTENAFVLNTFVVLDLNDLPIDDPVRIAELHDRLNNIITNPALVPAPVQQRIPRQVKHFQFDTEIRFSLDEANNRTIMEIIAYDRPGLLSRIGYALVACNIRVVNAKIATFGERAEDIFFIRSADNAPVRPDDEECLQREVYAALRLGANAEAN